MHTTTLDYSTDKVRPREGGFVIDFNTGSVFLQHGDIECAKYARTHEGDRVLITVSRAAFIRLERERMKP